MPQISTPRRELDLPDVSALESRVRGLLQDPSVRAACDHIRRNDELTVRQQIELSEIPAPTFGEGERAARMAELLTAAGARAIETDREGNVLARVDGRTDGPPLVVSAHLDTVFPAGTDPSVRREGEHLTGPGISDDARGLAALLTLVRAIDVSGLEPPVPLLVVATVGEEGAGDLRGVRYLFGEEGGARDARGFISLDGAGLRRIVSLGLGSLRLRLTGTGPGGHSWVDWGTPNPIHVLGRVVQAATAMELPTHPRAALTVARWSGGTSINAIPQEAWIELDMRSEDPGALDSMNREVRRLAEEAVARINGDAPAEAAPVTLQWTTIGHRPPGRTDRNSHLVRAATAATRALDVEPELAVSSTDANIPMSLGIPAVTLGAGGEAGLAHTTDEWYRNVRGPEGIVRALLTVLLTGEDP